MQYWLLTSNADCIKQLIVVSIFKEANNCYSSKQFGFRKSKSTEDALEEVMGQIYANLNGGKPISCNSSWFSIGSPYP